LLFSPCQTLRRKPVEEALGIQMDVGSESHLSIGTFESAVAVREALVNMDVWDLDISHEVSVEIQGRDEEQEFVKTVNKLHSDGYSSREIVNKLFKDYIYSTQTTFYPLIATLFKIMGFNCSFSRPGDNGARWDAIIDDPTRSIPIEIKSPTEEQSLSIKAIRQALENKIILLSRKTHATTPEVTTLAVGYNMPNERAEVNRLIADFKATYGYRIGVIDLKSLLSISVSILVDNKTFDKEKLYSLEGLANANI
jgi:hypothetical protein